MVLLLDEILQVSLTNEVLDFLLEVDALFDVITVVFVLVTILAFIPLECAFSHSRGRVAKFSLSMVTKTSFLNHFNGVNWG